MLRVTTTIFVAISLFALAQNATASDTSPSPHLTGEKSGSVKTPARQAVPNSSRVRPIQGQMLMMKVPTNATEMLENVKLGLAENVFLREEFYENANINKVFGVAKGYGIIWQEKKTAQRRGDYPYPIPPFDEPPPSPHNFVQSGFVDWAMGDERQRQRVRTVVGFAVTSFNVDVVQSVFGKPAEIREGRASLPPPHGLPAYMPDPKKHPLGNSKLIYRKTDAKTEKTVSFRTNGVGQVLDFQIVEEEM